MNTIDPNKLTNGGPAFPAETVNGIEGNLIDPFGTLLPPGLQCTYPGMTLRDYFAAKAMPLAMKFWTEVFYPLNDAEAEHPFSTDYSSLLNKVAESSWEMADAMLKARTQ